LKKLLTITLILFSSVAFACSCGSFLIDLPIKEMGWTQTQTTGISSISDIIFSGILLDTNVVEETYLDSQSKEYKEKRLELIFKLKRSYKGYKSDTIRIRTNVSSDACGFIAKINTECLIFGSKSQDGYYYTYRSDCCKSISKEKDKKRYNKYIKFLESLTNMIDGEYVFFQPRPYWNGGSRTGEATMEAIRYNIKKGKLEGTWQVKDRRGRVLEKGEYKNGQKIGVWEVISYTKSDLKEANEQVRTEKIRFRNGDPLVSEITIEDKDINWYEDPPSSKVLRKQQFVKEH
jgi:hypothetical protein